MVQASFIMLRTEFHIEVARVSPLFRVILLKECAEVSTMEAITECVKVIKPSMGSFFMTLAKLALNGDASHIHEKMHDKNRFGCAAVALYQEIEIHY